MLSWSPLTALLLAIDDEEYLKAEALKFDLNQCSALRRLEITLLHPYEVNTSDFDGMEHVARFLDQGRALTGPTEIVFTVITPYIEQDTSWPYLDRLLSNVDFNGVPSKRLIIKTERRRESVVNPEMLRDVQELTKRALPITFSLRGPRQFHVTYESD